MGHRVTREGIGSFGGDVVRRSVGQGRRPPGSSLARHRGSGHRRSGQPFGLAPESRRRAGCHAAGSMVVVEPGRGRATGRARHSGARTGGTAEVRHVSEDHSLLVVVLAQDAILVQVEAVAHAEPAPARMETWAS